MATNDLTVGDPAPDFTAPVVGGKWGDEGELTLSELRGRRVVLYFYPKDDTPGCTKQACGIRDDWEALSRKAEVLGVSADKPAKHRKFIDKYALPFALVSDTDKKIVEAYRVWGEKKLYGKLYFGILRTTYLIDAEGVVEAVFPKVKPATHAEMLLEAMA